MILVNSQVASFPPAARAHTVVALPPSPLPATQRLARVVGMSLVGSQQPLGRAGWCARCRAALRTCTRARAPTATYTTHSRSTTLCIDPTCGKRGTRMSTPPWRRRKKPGNPLETPSHSNSCGEDSSTSLRSAASPRTTPLTSARNTLGEWPNSSSSWYTRAFNAKTSSPRSATSRFRHRK